MERRRKHTSDNIFSGNGGGGNKIAVLQACTVLYNSLPRLDAAAHRAGLEQIVGPCTVEWSPVGTGAVTAGPNLTGGVAAFGEHKVALVALSAPVRPEVLDVTVDVSPMPENLRRAMMEHQAAIRLLYIGTEPDPVEQLTALFQVARVLMPGALGIINERAALAQPTELTATLLPHLGDEVPPIQLWTGVVTFALGEDAGVPRYLLRTYGMDQMALPEAAIYLTNRALADDAYNTLMNVCLYLVQNRSLVTLGVGDRVEFSGRTYLLTDPANDDPEFVSDTGLLLLVEV